MLISRPSRQGTSASSSSRCNASVCQLRIGVICQMSTTSATMAATMPCSRKILRKGMNRKLLWG